MQTQTLVNELENLIRVLNDGCTDHGCKVKPSTGGQRTNGGCNCHWYIKRQMRTLNHKIEKEGFETNRTYTN